LHVIGTKHLKAKLGPKFLNIWGLWQTIATRPDQEQLEHLSVPPYGISEPNETKNDETYLSQATVPSLIINHQILAQATVNSFYSLTLISHYQFFR